MLLNLKMLRVRHLLAVRSAAATQPGGALTRPATRAHVGGRSERRLARSRAHDDELPGGVSERPRTFTYVLDCATLRRAPRGRANSTKNPSPRQNPTERPTDPARCGKGGPKGGIKEEPNAQALCRKNLDFFPDDRQTPARREARNHRSEDAEMLGPLPRGPQRTGRADQREARGDANRDRSTQNHRRRVLLSATQRTRSTNNETTTTTRHPELRDPRSDSSEDKLRGVACSFIERH